MKITIESTAHCTHIDGVPVRAWKGVTEQGTACVVFVHRITSIAGDRNELDAELRHMPEPAELQLPAVLRQLLPGPGRE